MAYSCESNKLVTTTNIPLSREIFGDQLWKFDHYPDQKLAAACAKKNIVYKAAQGKDVIYDGRVVKVTTLNNPLDTYYAPSGWFFNEYCQKVLLHHDPLREENPLYTWTADRLAYLNPEAATLAAGHHCKVGGGDSTNLQEEQMRMQIPALHALVGQCRRDETTGKSVDKNFTLPAVRLGTDSETAAKVMGGCPNPILVEGLKVPLLMKPTCFGDAALGKTNLEDMNDTFNVLVTLRTARVIFAAAPNLAKHVPMEFGSQPWKLQGEEKARYEAWKVKGIPELQGAESTIVDYVMMFQAIGTVMTEKNIKEIDLTRIGCGVYENLPELMITASLVMCATHGVRAKLHFTDQKEMDAAYALWGKIKENVMGNNLVTTIREMAKVIGPYAIDKAEAVAAAKAEAKKIAEAAEAAEALALQHST